MTTIRIVLGLILALLGGGVVALNLWIMVCEVRGRRPPSPLPLVGGIIAGICLAILPVRYAILLAPIPVLLDWGGVLGIFSGLIRRG